MDVCRSSEDLSPCVDSFRSASIAVCCLQMLAPEYFKAATNLHAFDPSIVLAEVGPSMQRCSTHAVRNYGMG